MKDSFRMKPTLHQKSLTSNFLLQIQKQDIPSLKRIQSKDKIILVESQENSQAQDITSKIKSLNGEQYPIKLTKSQSSHNCSNSVGSLAQMTQSQPVSKNIIRFVEKTPSKQGLRQVKEILFAFNSSAKRKENNQSLIRKYFKKLKLYIKLKSRVKAFLNDEINVLNREFVELQKCNIDMQQAITKQKFLYLLKLDTQQSRFDKVFSFAQVIQKSEFKFEFLNKAQVFAQLKVNMKKFVQLKNILRKRFYKLSQQCLRTWNLKSQLSKLLSIQSTKTIKARPPRSSRQPPSIEQQHTATTANTSKSQSSIFTENITRSNNSSLERKHEIEIGCRNLPKTQSSMIITQDKQNSSQSKRKPSRDMDQEGTSQPIKEQKKEDKKIIVNQRLQESTKKRFFDTKLLLKLQRLKELDRGTSCSTERSSNQQQYMDQIKEPKLISQTNILKFNKQAKTSTRNQQNISSYMKTFNPQQTTIQTNTSASGFLHGETVFIQQLEPNFDVSSQIFQKNLNFSITDQNLESMILATNISSINSQNAIKEQFQQPIYDNYNTCTPNFAFDQKKNKSRTENQTDQQRRAFDEQVLSPNTYHQSKQKLMFVSPSQLERIDVIAESASESKTNSNQTLTETSSYFILHKKRIPTPKRSHNKNSKLEKENQIPNIKSNSTKKIINF